MLKTAGLKAEAREIVFLGADHGVEEVEWRTQKYSLDQQFGRSMQRDKALSAEPLLAYAYNDEPLTRHQGFPRAPDRARAGTASPTSSGCRTSSRSRIPTWASTRRAGTAP